MDKQTALVQITDAAKSAGVHLSVPSLQFLRTHLTPGDSLQFLCKCSVGGRMRLDPKSLESRTSAPSRCLLAVTISAIYILDDDQSKVFLNAEAKVSLGERSQRKSSFYLWRISDERKESVLDGLEFDATPAGALHCALDNDDFESLARFISI